jgi:hypothetical protein
MANLESIKKTVEDTRKAATGAAKEKPAKKKSAKEKAAREKTATKKATTEKTAAEKMAMAKAAAAKAVARATSGKATVGKAAAAGKAAKVGSKLSRTDVEAILDAKAEAKGLRSDWRDSLTGLLKAMDMKTSLASRKALAAKLKYSGDAADGSDEKDMWLHAQLIKAIAKNGGELPPDLL